MFQMQILPILPKIHILSWAHKKLLKRKYGDQICDHLLTKDL